MKSINVSLVLCAAVLAAGCVTKQTYNTEVQKADTYAALDTKLSGELSSDQAQITQLQNQLKVTLVNEVLFAEGGSTLNASSSDQGRTDAGCAARPADCRRGLYRQRADRAGAQGALPFQPVTVVGAR